MFFQFFQRFYAILRQKIFNQKNFSGPSHHPSQGLPYAVGLGKKIFWRQKRVFFSTFSTFLCNFETKKFLTKKNFSGPSQGVPYAVGLGKKNFGVKNVFFQLFQRFYAILRQKIF